MKKLLLVLALFLSYFGTQATHILGGELFYEYLSGTTYKVTLILYRDCNPGTAGLPTSVSISGCPASGSGNNVNATLNRISINNLPTEYFLNPCLKPPSGGACIEEHVYEGNMNLPNGEQGFLLTYNTCCRSNAITNLDNPGSKYATYYVFVPDFSDPSVGTGNNSARFVTSPPPNICVNDSINYNHAAVDPDGDVVTYEFFNPKGNTSSQICQPLANTPFINPYSANYPIASAAPAFSINATTGELIGKANQTGYFVYCVKYTETRGGVPISYGVRDFVFNITGCSPQTPIADFDPQATFDTTMGYCGDLSLSLTNTSQQSIDFLWDFGDTAITTDTSTIENPMYQYDRPGKYDIMLISAPGRPCADTLILEYEVFPAVYSAFTPPDTQCLDNNYFTFVPDSINPEDSVIWDFGPNATPQFGYEFEMDSVQFNTAGNHTVSLIMLNETCRDTAYGDVYVAPSISAFYTPKDPGCVVNNFYDFDAQGTFGSGADILWDFGANANLTTSTDQTVFGVIFNQIGYQTVSLTVSELGCSRTYIDSVLITDTVKAGFSPLDTQCLNSNSYDLVNIGNHDTTATFIWSFGNANPDSSFVENPQGVHFNTNGMQYITLIIEQNGCSDTYIDSVFVTDAPIGAFDTIPNTCIANATMDFEADGAYNPNSVFTWDFGPGANPQTANTEDVTGVTFNSLGTQTVTLTISDNGCTDVTTRQFDVTSSPSAGFPPVADQCLSNGPFDFINTGTYGPDATFLWDFDANVTPLTATTEDVLGIQWTQPGTYTVCLTVTENGCSDNICNTFTLTPAPLASFDTLATQSIANNSYNLNNTGVYGGTATFSWTFENGIPATSVLENPSNVSFTQIGYNDITLSITENGCTDVYVDSVYIAPVPQPYFARPAQQCLDVNDFTFSSGGANGNTATFAWDFGPNATPATSTDSIVNSVVFNSVGGHLVTLTVTEFGASDSYTDTVFVTAAPNPTFTPGPTQCVSGNSYDFLAQGTYGSNATFNWEFGSNASIVNDTTANPTGISFNTPGFHPITLTVSEDGCNISYTDSVEIVANPVAQTPIPAAQCITGNSFDFNGGGTFGPTATFFWDFGPNASVATSTNQNELGVSYAATGIHPAKFAVTEFGCTDTFRFNVRVTEQPIAGFTPPGPQCVSTSSFDFTYGGTFDTTTTYLWDFGNASPVTATNRNPQNVTFYSTGYQVITLTVSGLGCSDTYIDSVLTTPNPVSIIDTFPEQCLGSNSFDFTHANSVYGSNATFYWDFGGNATPGTSTDENPTGIVFNSAGLHTVSLLVEENGCQSTSDVEVLVTPNPVAGFAPLAAQCVDNNSFDFTFDGVVGGNSTFSWDFGPDAIPTTSADENPVGITFGDTGTFTVSVSITDNGCSDTYTSTVEVLSPPRPNFEGFQTGCVPFTANFTNLSESETPMTYFWDFGDGGTSTATNPSHEYTVAGLYNVTLTVTTNDGCIGSYDTTIAGIVSAQDIPLGGFKSDKYKMDIFGAKVYIESTTIGADSVYYIVSGDPNPIYPDTFTYAFLDTGIYTMTQISISSAGCLDTAMRTFKVDPKYTFFSPNAFSPDKDGKNESFIQKGSGIVEYEMVIVNRWGEEIYRTQNIKTGWNGNDRDGTDAKPGNYAYTTRIKAIDGEEYVYRGKIILIK